MKRFISAHYFVGSLYNWNSVVSLYGSFSLLIFNGTNVLIEELSIQNGTGYGLASVNVYDVEIITSSFTRNNIDSVGHKFDGVGGNMRFAYIESTACPNNVNKASAHVSMRNVSLSFGKNFGDYKIKNPKLFNFAGTGGGLAIIGVSSMCGLPEFELDVVNVIGNVAGLGSNMYVLGLPIPMTINRLNCSLGEQAFIGSGLTMYVTLSPSQDWTGKLQIFNSMFIGNKAEPEAPGAAIIILTYSSKFYDLISLQSSTFSENIGYSVIQFAKNNDDTHQLLRVNLVDIELHHNRGNLNYTMGFASALYLENSVCNASGLVVKDHPYSGIQLSRSSITFSGTNLIENNRYDDGGGLRLLERSKMYFRPPTNVSFVNNHASRYGGGIYLPVDKQRYYVGPCFYQIDDPSGSATPDVVIYAVGNTAGLAGNFLSGGDLGVCYEVGNRSVSFMIDKSNNDFISFIQPKVNLSDNLYFVSSPPVAVFNCNPNGEPDTSQPSLIPLSGVYLGKPFNVSFSTHGYLGGVSPGTVSIATYNESVKNLIMSSNYTTSNTCVTYASKLTGNKYTEMMYIVVKAEHEVFYLPSGNELVYSIELSGCPPGFTQEEVCVCNSYIDMIASCNISANTLTTNGSVWISYDNTTNETVYGHSCPYDYCVNENVSFNILDPDQQCANHRSGVLCGECADGYSLLLGSNECGECPNNNYLSLLLVFGIAGIALVVLLIVLNLTVSVGTINGLIFYANIIKINEDVFFPNDSSRPFILRQFISFVNLDFGLKACFYSGMTPYVKAWLQFVFPLYIWLIILIISIASNHFTKLSKLMGNNAVKVLATLQLLSYTKIIRAIGIALSSEKIYVDGVKHTVWKYDGNMAYDSVEHILLIIFALFLLCLFVIPYSLLMISLPFIDSILTKVRFNRLWLKAFTDAYSGPFINTQQFWVGMLLIARVILTIVKNVIVDDDVFLYLTTFCMMAFLTIALDIQGPYKKRYLNILESWFLVNLLGISIFGLGKKSVARVGSSVSVSLVFVTFACIVTLHVYWFLHEHINLTWMKGLFQKEKEVHIFSESEGVAAEDGINQSLISGTSSCDYIRSRSGSVQLVSSVADKAPLMGVKNSGSSKNPSTNSVKDSLSPRRADFSRYRESFFKYFDDVSSSP